jgi:hypothetical protein
MVGPLCPEGSTWTRWWFLDGHGRPSPLGRCGQGENPRVFLWAKAKETRGGEGGREGEFGCLTPSWGARKPPWTVSLAYLKGRGGPGYVDACKIHT